MDGHSQWSLELSASGQLPVFGLAPGQGSGGGEKKVEEEKKSPQIPLSIVRHDTLKQENQESYFQISMIF